MAYVCGDGTVLRTLSDAIQRYGVPVPSDVIHGVNRMTQEEVDAERRRLGDPLGDPRESEEQAVLGALSRSGVPDRFLRVPADRRPVPALLSGSGLYAFGPAGVGKTWLACSVMRGWVASGRRARFASSLTLLSDLRECYEGRASEADVVGAYSTAPLLVLDDLGKEVPTAWALSKLFEVFDRRYGARLPMVVTSQFEPAGLGQHLAREGDRDTAYAVVSRIEETCAMRDMRGMPDRRRA